MPSPAKGKRDAPTAEEMRPPVYEEGSNVGPNIAEDLDCEHLDADLFRSNQKLWRPVRARGVFGGQVIGQAITVSNRSVREGVQLHSLHCYFLLAGDEKIPIYYHVSRLRDGGSYVTRLVEAKQKGKCIFVLFTSYAKPEPDRPRFAIPQPAVIYNHASDDKDDDDGSPSSSSSSSSTNGNPEEARPATSSAISSSSSSSSFPPASSALQAGVSSIESRFSRNRAKDGNVQGLIPYEKSEDNEKRYTKALQDFKDVLPDHVKETLQGWIKDRRESSIEIRNALPGMYDEYGIPTSGHEQAYWLRSKVPVEGGQDAQKAALAYASDMNLLGTVAKALGNSRRVQMMASLDHSMWFYEDFDMNKPMLFFMQAQISSHGRGLAMGRFYSQEGKLLAIVAQEGLVRAQEKGDSSRSFDKTSKL